MKINAEYLAQHSGTWQNPMRAITFKKLRTCKEINTNYMQVNYIKVYGFDDEKWYHLLKLKQPLTGQEIALKLNIISGENLKCTYLITQ